MKCEKCGNTDTKVTDSRVNKNGSRVRLRCCEHCNHRFKTTEILGVPKSLLPLLANKVQKKDGTIVDFDEDKLINSISISIPKADRNSVPLLDIVNAVKQEFDSSIDGTIVNTRQIGDCVLNEIKKHNLLAYIRYASVYKDFKSVELFNQFVRDVTNKN